MWDRTVYGRYLNHKWEINICGRQLSGRLYPLYGLLFSLFRGLKQSIGRWPWTDFFLVCLSKSLRSRIMGYARKCSIFYTNLVSLRHPPTGSEVLELGEFSLIFLYYTSKVRSRVPFFSNGCNLYNFHPSEHQPSVSRGRKSTPKIFPFGVPRFPVRGPFSS